ncbi:MAG: tail fiber domain-containing protein, partial [Bacteroidia bacterium]|nr:tail fiber domain-containing protein [Bacteroidia bacterium]
LKPVSYNTNPEILHKIWGTPDSIARKIDHSEIKQQRFIGLIAQDVEQAMKEANYTHFPGIEIPQTDNQTYSLRYGDFIPPIIKSVQELDAENQKLKSELQTVKTENSELKSKLETLEQRMQSLEFLLRGVVTR